MTRLFVGSAAACIAASISLSWAAVASADEVRPTPSSSLEAPFSVTSGSSDDGGNVAWPGRSHKDSTKDDGPGGPLILSGLVTLSISYVPAFVLATESTVPIDQKLFIPVAGPWMDLANRPMCGSATVPCSLEVGDQILLVADGIVQAAGAIEILAGLAALANEGAPPDTAKNDAKENLRASIHFAPAQFGPGGYGISAVGKF